MAGISAVFDKGASEGGREVGPEGPGGPRRGPQKRGVEGGKAISNCGLVLNRAWLPLSITSTIRHQGCDGAQSVGHWAKDEQFLVHYRGVV